ncbi:hypothetical protein B0H16DRAFT_1728775 [Mycena metata]|uniref:Uncharacterized protein n=1 Tax=Mycena metata TaxID=1033252 RepID=A0AAD7IFZ5_9AGAR|nr:hypothetical protein B0H16DRAFT_1728775 [Mycena metata]
MRERVFFARRTRPVSVSPPQLYDRRALDTSSALPLFNSLTRILAINSTTTNARTRAEQEADPNRPRGKILQITTLRRPPPLISAFTRNRTPPPFALPPLRLYLDLDLVRPSPAPSPSPFASSVTSVASNTSNISCGAVYATVCAINVAPSPSLAFPALLSFPSNTCHRVTVCAAEPSALQRMHLSRAPCALRSSLSSWFFPSPPFPVLSPPSHPPSAHSAHPATHRLLAPRAFTSALCIASDHLLKHACCMHRAHSLDASPSCISHALLPRPLATYFHLYASPMPSSRTVSSLAALTVIVYMCTFRPHPQHDAPPQMQKGLCVRNGGVQHEWTSE